MQGFLHAALEVSAGPGHAACVKVLTRLKSGSSPTDTWSL
jgi:hypothetical protein